MEDSRIEVAISQISTLLVPNEKLESTAVQRRLFSLWHRRSLVAATSGRFIGVVRGLFGSYAPDDVRWQDLKEVRIKVGIFGSDLTIVAMTNPDLAITGAMRTLFYSGLRKREAEAVYRICQAQEQAWREKRRVRELEELRAKSGGFNFDAAGSRAMGASAGAGSEDPAQRLERARTMLEKGLISDSEYESLKARIVGSL